MADDGTYDLISKKEILQLEREKAKLLKVLEGIRGMDRPPGMIFILDTRKEKIAQNEANKLKIPIVGICDTNSDPQRIEFPVPGNDDAIRSIKFFASYVADTVLEAKTTKLEGGDAVEPAPVASAAESGEAAPEVQ
jgi:small subunit ribosomal protein S2